MRRSLILVPCLLLATFARGDLSQIRRFRASAKAALTIDRYSDAAFFYAEAIAAAKAADLPTTEYECILESVAMAMQMQRLAEVVEQLTRLLELETSRSASPKAVARTKLFLGMSLCASKQTTAAETIVRETVAIATKRSQPIPEIRSYAYATLADWHTLVGNQHEAEENYRRGAAAMLKDEPPSIPGIPSPLASLARYYRKTGRLARAVKVCQRYLDFMTRLGKLHDPSPHLEMACCHLAAGRPEKASPFLGTATELIRKANDPLAYQSLCAVLFEHDLRERARTILQEDLAAFARKGDLIGMRRIALLYRDFGCYEDSARVFTRLLEHIEKSDPRLTSYLGLIAAEEYSIVLWNLGREEEAAAVVDRVPALRHKSTSSDDP